MPEMPALMHDVERHQRADEAKVKDYIFRRTETMDESDGHGGVKKREVRAFDVFWLGGVEVQRLVSKDGQPLSAAELRKEDERIDKEVAKAKEKREKGESKGQATDSHGNEEVPVSRILELGTFSNARRVQRDGRDTIVADYTGDPKAKTRNQAEEVIHDLVGTVWIDEQDKELVQTQGQFARSFKIGGGLVANIHEGTSFSMRQQKVNGEVWLPIELEFHGTARILLLLKIDGSARIVDSDFRKFKATSTLLPGVGPVEDHP